MSHVDYLLFIKNLTLVFGEDDIKTFGYIFGVFLIIIDLSMIIYFINWVYKRKIRKTFGL